MLTDTSARRCSACGKRVRANKLRVLGDETRVTATVLPVDRWMIDRLHGTNGMPPVAWEGRYATPTTPNTMVASAVAATLTPAAPPAPAPVDTPATPPVSPTAPSDLGSPVEPTKAPVAPTGDHEKQPDPAPDASAAEAPAAEQAPAFVDALALDQYTQPNASVAESPQWRSKQTVGDGVSWPARREQLDPEVRALVEELYNQARAEMESDAKGGEPQGGGQSS
jgi:hypothetical protein